ncbi:vacuole membrane protein 1 isoform X2 [Daktulosphaira vitifoliae]|uniref:vacuole membrane protein 1 isoform X2 n=1 Tax=Daktulosphaira vitifoliae TaxID=58002 RepID=UPI0021A9FBC8|nr:vacuole membrane protein 1 isoform X2 [Daktulosphaira vitifoliae]XP_050543581.1 vacuole membrane protein 1 isoform X2 [Daktulosphaira vitifoliae]
MRHKSKGSVTNNSVGESITLDSKPSSKQKKNSKVFQNGNSKLKQLKKSVTMDPHSIVIWKHPILTIDCFCKEVVFLTKSFIKKLICYKLYVLLAFLVISSPIVLSYIEGPHVPVLLWAKSRVSWCLYWLGLGVLSSVGFGTGLHTFLLYLGPHITSVTLAAYECGGLNFPEPPYPDQIICPDELDPTWTASLWNIMSKVSLEAMMWGAGTALGELPPYFMARAARLSGRPPDEDKEDLIEFEELLKKEEHPETMTLVDKSKIFVEKLVKKVGFFGILACASIPNPLFDLAGITCGHFLIPFWTFFGATLLGKAAIKMSIQVLFVVIAFNETLIESVLEMVGKIPGFGKKLQAPITKFLENQKQRLHLKKDSKGTNIVVKLFDLFVFSMVMYFIVSLVNSLAQNYYKRNNKTSKKVSKD